jgi:hypothetical protein
MKILTFWKWGADVAIIRQQGEDALIMWRKGLQEPEFGLILQKLQNYVWAIVTLSWLSLIAHLSWTSLL